MAASLPQRIQPIVLAFYVEREAEVSSDAGPERVLWSWRLDHLNVKQSYLGYTRPRSGAALVLLDQIETELVTYVLPALPEGEGVVLVDVESLDGDAKWQAELAKRCGEVVRAYIASGSGVDSAAITRLGVLLARRRTLVEKWRTSIAGLGLTLRVPKRLIPEADYSAELDVRVPRGDLYEWNDIHEELLSSRMEKAFVSVRDRYARDVERHEVQHRLDFARDLIPVPDALAKQLDIRNTLDAPSNSVPGRARDELSAYLAAMGSTDDSPMLTLVLLGRFVFDESWLRDPYAYAAFVAIDEMAREVGVADSGPLVAPGRIRREAMSQRFLALLSKSPKEIHDAACRVWERLYGLPLPHVTEGRVIANEPWRH
jgi:hypothetical protein